MMYPSASYASSRMDVRSIKKINECCHRFIVTHQGVLSAKHHQAANESMGTRRSNVLCGDVTCDVSGPRCSRGFVGRRMELMRG